MTRRARSPFPASDVVVDVASDEPEELEAQWPETALIASSARDRAATVARPLSQTSVAQPLTQTSVAVLDKPQDGDDERGTTIIAPQARLTPRLMGERPPSRHSFSALRIGRTVLMAMLLYYALSSGVQLAGGSAFPLAPFPWAASSGAASAAPAFALRMDGKVASRVRPMTQMRRPDLYDSKAQFNQWSGSACSAASLAEILTAYGLPNMTIGRMIREMGSDISSNWGLLTYNAFNKVASKYGLRADVYLESNPLTYKQMLYLTNTLGIPVTINMRATTGYYHFLSGGHILVMTGGDSKTIRLTDSSLYYMKSLPISTYNQMARSRNVVIVPKDFHYTLPH